MNIFNFYNIEIIFPTFLGVDVQVNVEYLYRVVVL